MRGLALAAVSAALLLAGCGGNDTKAREAFTGFLQTRILDKPGVHVPKPTEQEQDAFGDYADDYAIITDFNTAVDKSISPRLAATMRDGSVVSLEDLVEQRGKFQAANETMRAINTALDTEVKRADAAHAALDQPAEVKAVYDKAYDRLVTQPATAFQAAMPAMTTVMRQATDLGGYIREHRDAVRVSGSTIEASDPAVLAEVNRRLQAMQGSQKAVLDAHARMRAVIYGGS